MARRDVEVKLLVGGINKTFGQSGVVGALGDAAEKIADEATRKVDELYPKHGFTNKHFAAKQYTTTHGITAYSVITQTPLARRAQAEHSALTQALDAGRS